MARPVTTYEPVERGIRKVIKTYPDGRVVVKHQIKYADSNGKIVSKTIAGSVARARSELAAARSEVEKGEHVVISKRDSRTTFKEAAEHWHAHSTHMKASTREGHRKLINGRLKPLHDVTMKGLTYQRLQAFQSSLAADGLAPATPKQIMWVVKAICSDAMKRGLLRTNPAKDLAKIRSQRTRVNMPSIKQVSDLISRLADPTPYSAHETTPSGREKLQRDVDPRWSLLVQTAAYTGLRAGELCGLQVRDFNPFNRSLTVVRNIPTKGRELGSPKSAESMRTLDNLGPRLNKKLASLAAGKRPTDYLFGVLDADGVSQSYNHLNFYRRHFKPACEELGIDFRFHDLRHFHASLLIDQGLNPVQVAHRLGHSTPSFTLNTYAHLFSTESAGLGERLKRAAAEEARPRQRKKPF